MRLLPVLGLLATFAPVSALAQQPVEEPPAPDDTQEPGEPSAPDEAPRPDEPPATEAVPPEPSNDEGAPDVTFPQIEHAEPPRYPDGAQGSRLVRLFVTVGSDGAPNDIGLAEGGAPTDGDDPFVRSAIDAVKLYRFTPARRGDTAVSARITVEVLVAPPEPPPTAAPPSAPPIEVPVEAPTSTVEHDHSGPHADDVHLEVTVHGNRAKRAERRSASDFFLHREVLDAAPHLEGADVLSSVPGLVLVRTEGLAVGHSYMLRGFDSEHGQDIAFSVGGLPINQPSHIHGQGYADLGFLVSEAVDQVHAKEGVRDPKQGDFAVAGSVDIDLGVDEADRGLQIRSGYGSFNRFEQKLLWAPKEAHRESFGAASYSQTDGYGENRSGQAASGIVQHRFGEGEVTYRAIGFISAARGKSAGMVPKAAIESGAVCFHCVMPEATAEAQNTSASRFMAGLFADYGGPEHANGTLGFWLGASDFSSKQNFTGYLEQSRTLPGVSGRGDLIDQRNQALSLGLTGRYRTEAFEPDPDVHGTLEVGVDGRMDQIAQGQNLVDGSVRNQIWDQRVDADINAVDLGFFGDLDFQLGDHVNARAGLRAAVLSYIVDDNLGNFAPSSRPEDTYIEGFNRSSMGATVGPRTSLEFKPLTWISLLASYGQGYRSPQARMLEDGETAPMAIVQSADAGVRFRFGMPLELTAVGYYTHLSDDVAFDPSEGAPTRIGATQRLGATAHAITRPTDWLLGSISVTYVHATLLEPPAPSAEDPAPPFVPGAALPYVPPLVVRLDTTAKTKLAQAGRYPLIGRSGIGFSFWAPRPLPYGQSSAPVSLLDASVGLGWGPFDFDLSGYNLLNLDYSAQESVFVSDWTPGEVPSRVPSRHIAAGPPISLMASLGVTL